MKQADITISGSLGFYSISAGSDAGREWMKANVQYDDWQAIHMNGIATDDTRFAHDIADGAMADGLHVEVNGRAYLGNNRVA